MNNQEKMWHNNRILPTGQNALTPMRDFTITQVTCVEEDSIMLFMKKEAMKEWRYYAEKVAFKGPQLLNGLAPSYRHLTDMIHGIRRFQAGWVSQPLGFLPMSDGTKNMWKKSLDNMFVRDYLSLIPASEPTTEQVLTFEKMRDMVKDFNIPIARSCRPFDFITPDLKPFDIFGKSFLEGGLSNLTIHHGKLRKEPPDVGKFYIDMEMPIDDKCFEAFIGKDKPVKELPPVSEHNFDYDPVRGMLSFVSDPQFDKAKTDEDKDGD